MKLGAPTADELGYAKSLAVQEIGGANVILLEQDASQGQVSPAFAPLRPSLRLPICYRE